jgi:hypothetical protein
MLTKLYVLLWLAVALVAAVLLATGKLSLTGVVVFGFIAFGLTFMGMIGVLPTVAKDQAPNEHTAEEI